MAKDLQQGEPAQNQQESFMYKETERININRYHEVKYWTEKLDLTVAQLADVIEAVGDTVDAVRTRVGR